MRCLVVGLGNFGTALAKELTDAGNEVIAVDPHDRNVDAIKDLVSTVYIMDATDESAISALPLSEIDIIFVTISEDLAASLRTVVTLQKNGGKNIYARANDDIHKQILEGIGNLKIIMPEVEMAKIYAKKLEEF
ncbi:TrkA family potassium uptake protein [Elizabethkingia sp. JS20170427COW]|uniref:potassium channel family protein n=1 Tax=Elizabethkingia sp. JS20170427COW TaxID=2583851 RepID=UPI0011106B24|nr:NAD-binding protein [Elizabethkingia sp. JS20170427COW]QCX54055.1 TrkA family potassium uptake protein [Elizabethkingia sp. JS20170427COW]